MNPQLERYVNNRARSLSRTFPTLDIGDLINDAWEISLREDDDATAFDEIRRRFNSVKMQTVREGKRYVPLERIENDLEFSDNPEDMLIAHLDLHDDIKELSWGATEWKTRILRKRIKKYLKE